MKDKTIILLIAIIITAGGLMTIGTKVYTNHMAKVANETRISNNRAFMSEQFGWTFEKGE